MQSLTEFILNAVKSLGVLDGRTFTLLVIMALVTTAMGAPLLYRARTSWLGRRKELRNPSRTSSGHAPDERAFAISVQQASSKKHQPVDGRALRTVCGNFATGVTVITTGGPDNPAGTTVNSFTSVSLEPPLVLFCLHRQSRLEPVVQESGGFVVNFLTHQQQSLAWAFSGRESARVEDVPHHRSASGLPVLSEALAFLECRLIAEYDGGDHAILLGEVIGLDAPADEEDPLIFYRGAMRVLDGAVPASHRR